MGVRVCHITSATEMIYGAVHSMMTLAEAQRAAGDEVTMIGFAGKPFCAAARARGFNVGEVRNRFKVDPFAARRVSEMLKDARVQVVHTHLSTSSITGCLAAKRVGIPCVSTVHGMSGKLSFTFADHLIGVSEGVKGHLVKQGISPSKITAIHNGIARPASLPTKSEARFKFSIPEDAFCFGTVARLTELKGIEHAIRAFDKIVAEMPNALYLIAGNGNQETHLKQVADQLGLGHRVKFVGYQEDVFGFLRTLDVFLFPSLKEAMGMSVAEALACGLPIVSTDVGGLPEVVTTQVGVLVPPAQPAAMATAALALVTASNFDKFGERAEERWREQFSVETMRSRTQQVYELLGVST
ncbi:MAG TPA: glycosyltransferase [Fimbriimonas sp.]|nr:glycosyltransferase [Fimbriimonas sp.]